MALVTSTTARQLQEAIVTLIESLTPSEERYRGYTWTHSADNRSIDASRQVRLFHIEWIPGDRIVGGMLGNGYEHDATVLVVVNYRGIPPRETGWLATDDHAQMVEALSSNLQDGGSGITGLTWAEGATVIPRDEAGTHELGLGIQYLKARTV